MLFSIFFSVLQLHGFDANPDKSSTLKMAGAFSVDREFLICLHTEVDHLISRWGSLLHSALAVGIAAYSIYTARSVKGIWLTLLQRQVNKQNKSPAKDENKNRQLQKMAWTCRGSEYL